MEHDLVDQRFKDLQKQFPAAWRADDHTSDAATCPCPFHNKDRARDHNATRTINVKLEAGTFECSACDAKGALDELLAGQLRTGVAPVVTTKPRGK